jgi:hypothetical protein
MNCDRCKNWISEDEDGNATWSVFYDKQYICQPCAAAEMKHPLFRAAIDALTAAKQVQNYGFHGIGVPKDLIPSRVCSLCGIEEDETEYGFLGDIRVTVMDGEEGYANIVHLLCDDCLTKQVAGLRKLGFVDHRHGSTNLLEDEDCPGYIGSMHNCPTPSEYGEYVVKPKVNNVG